MKILFDKIKKKINSILEIGIVSWIHIIKFLKYFLIYNFFN